MKAKIQTIHDIQEILWYSNGLTFLRCPFPYPTYGNFFH